MNFHCAIPQTEAAILMRLMERPQIELTPGAAEYFLEMRFDDQDLARMNYLSELAREGILTPGQEAELDSYIHVANLVAVIQSKARRALGTY